MANENRLWTAPESSGTGRGAPVLHPEYGVSSLCGVL